MAIRLPGKYIDLSEDELKLYNSKKGNRTDREILLSGVGIYVEPLPRGRPSTRFKFDRPKRGGKFLYPHPRSISADKEET